MVVPTLKHLATQSRQQHARRECEDTDMQRDTPTDAVAVADADAATAAETHKDVDEHADVDAGTDADLDTPTLRHTSASAFPKPMPTFVAGKAFQEAVPSTHIAFAVRVRPSSAQPPPSAQHVAQDSEGHASTSPRGQRQPARRVFFESSWRRGECSTQRWTSGASCAGHAV